MQTFRENSTDLYVMDTTTSSYNYLSYSKLPFIIAYFLNKEICYIGIDKRMGENGWIPLQTILQLDSMGELGVDYSLLLAIGKGTGSNQNRPTYEINKMRTHMRRIERFIDNFLLLKYYLSYYFQLYYLI